jgi:hypothetical protein
VGQRRAPAQESRPPSPLKRRPPPSPPAAQHDFAPADATIRDGLLPTAARLTAGLDAAMAGARAVVACCRARHVSKFGRLVKLLLLAAGGFTGVFVVGVALAWLGGRRRRSSSGLQLPTTFGSARPPSGSSFGSFSRPGSRAATPNWGL